MPASAGDRPVAGLSTAGVVTGHTTTPDVLRGGGGNGHARSGLALSEAVPFALPHSSLGGGCSVRIWAGHESTILLRKLAYFH